MPEGDGIVELGTSGSLGGSVTMMKVTEALLEQNFVLGNQKSQHSSQRLSDTNDNVSEQTKLGYLTEQRVVGVREAKAMGVMNTDAIASSILQQRSVANQPQPSVVVTKD